MSDLDQSQRQASILMSSIQKKLVTLFQPSCKEQRLDQPDITVSAVSVVKTTQKMQLNDLDCSQVKHSSPTKPQQTSVKASSSVLNQINRMEAFYVDKIRELEVKVDRLENDNRDFLAEVEGLRISLQNCQSELKKQLAFNQKNVDAAVEEMSAKMVTKFGEEAAEYFKQAEKQKEALKADVYKEKAMRMRLEDELIALKEEKESLESFYYSLVENHRRLLKADIERNKASLHKSSTSASQLQTSSAKKTHYSAREEKEVLQTQLSRVRRQSKQLRKSQKKVKRHIPFVASEIQIIKNKLHSK